jgi:hypothetical protein
LSDCFESTYHIINAKDNLSIRSFKNKNKNKRISNRFLSLEEKKKKQVLAVSSE